MRYQANLINFDIHHISYGNTVIPCGISLFMLNFKTMNLEQFLLIQYVPSVESYSRIQIMRQYSITYLYKILYCNNDIILQYVDS